MENEQSQAGNEGKPADGGGSAARPGDKPRKRQKPAQQRAAVRDLLEGSGAVDREDNARDPEAANRGGENGGSSGGGGEARGGGNEDGGANGDGSRKGDERGGQGGDAKGASGGGAGEKPRTWKALAEKAGLEDADLFELELELAGHGEDGKGSVVKLGAVKDFLQAHGLEAEGISGLMANAERDRDEAREQREKTVSDMVQVRRDLSSVIALMGKAPPGALEQIKVMEERYLEREHKSLLDACPEWKDNEAFKRDRAEIAGILKPYGVSELELGNLAHSGMWRFFRDNLRSRREAKRALERAGERPDNYTRGNGSPSGRGASDASLGMRSQIARAKSGGRVDKVRAVGSLLSKSR